MWQGVPHFKQDKVKEIKRAIMFNDKTKVFIRFENKEPYREYHIMKIPKEFKSSFRVSEERLNEIANKGNEILENATNDDLEFESQRNFKPTREELDEMTRVSEEYLNNLKDDDLNKFDEI